MIRWRLRLGAAVSIAVLIVSPQTASALAPHARSRAWVMFAQVTTPHGGAGPILIEGVRGDALGGRLRDLAFDNAYEVMLIGLIEAVADPDQIADAIAEQYATDALLHDNWYKATPGLLAFIQHAGQRALHELLGATHPAGLPEAPVDVSAMAKILGVSVPTVRRMVTAQEIPCVRFGRMLRFVPRDVIASLQRRGR